MHFPRRLGRAALAMLVGAALAPALGAQDSRGDISPTPEVRKLEFHGVSDAIDLEDLKAHIYTTATKCRSFLLAPICAFSNYRGFEERHYLDHQELARDVLRIKVYYFRKGYRETQVDTTVTRLNEKEVVVRFDVVEGPPTVLTAVDVVYDSTLLSPKKVKSLTLLHTGEPLDLFAMDTMRVNFQNALWELGYADALVETGSRMDDIIFEEFKGTGNCEIKLDRSLAEKRIYPAIDIATSGTRREEKLFRPDQLDHVYTLRRGLGQMPPQAAMEWLIKRIANTPSNDALLEGL